jgi:hypothetical protein
MILVHHRPNTTTGITNIIPKTGAIAPVPIMTWSIGLLGDATQILHIATNHNNIIKIASVRRIGQMIFLI